MVFIISVLIAIGSLLLFINAKRKVQQERNQTFQAAATISGVIFVIFTLVALSRGIVIIPPDTSASSFCLAALPIRLSRKASTGSIHSPT